MSTPFFSVVIPTHNRAELLRQAVQSVLDQTYENFEVIIVDDHSTDHTYDCVNSFNDIRITYVINNRAKGGAGTRNTGIFMSRGEWIAFLDDDDIWLPKKLELQYKKIQEVGDDVGLIYTGYASYDFEKRHEMITNIPEKEGWLEKELLYENHIGTFSTVAIMKRLLHEAGGLDERFGGMQDMELYVRIATISRIVFIPEIMVHVRHSNTDRISLNPQKKLDSSLLFWEKYRENMNNEYRLHHRAATRVFINAFKLWNYEYILKSLPWTLTGIFIDMRNFKWLLKLIYGEVRMKLKRRSN